MLTAANISIRLPGPVLTRFVGVLDTVAGGAVVGGVGVGVVVVWVWTTVVLVLQLPP